MIDRIVLVCVPDSDKVRNVAAEYNWLIMSATKPWPTRNATGDSSRKGPYDHCFIVCIDCSGQQHVLINGRGVNKDGRCRGGRQRKSCGLRYQTCTAYCRVSNHASFEGAIEVLGEWYLAWPAVSWKMDCTALHQTALNKGPDCRELRRDT